MTKLKTCPFCGRTAHLYHTTDNHHAPFIQCDGAIQFNGTPSCYAQTRPWTYKTDEECIEAWNRRVEVKE
ncbi:MAG TPA: hypothetical protein DCW90_00435 [Lachnospiraceae bacterium]|nr:hypothetical protein [Lachnospiraceae bacterium]